MTPPVIKEFTRTNEHGNEIHFTFEAVRGKTCRITVESPLSTVDHTYTELEAKALRDALIAVYGIM